MRSVGGAEVLRHRPDGSRLVWLKVAMDCAQEESRLVIFPHRRCHRTTVGLWVWLTAWRGTGTLGSVDLQEQRAEPRQRGQDAALLSVGNVAIGANQDGSIGLNLEEGMNCGAMAQRNVCL